jgi:hypothetical protein
VSLRLALAAALLLPAATPALAQTQAAPSPARLALGRQLAQVLNSEAMIERQVATFADMFVAMLSSDPDVAALEKEYPGAIQVMTKAALPVVTAATRKSMPQLWDRLAALYAANLDEAELREAIAFYSGPIGMRVIAAINAHADLTPMMRDAVASENGTVSSGAMRETLGKTVAIAVKALAPADRNALAQFNFTPAGSRLNGLKPQVVQIATEWTNAPDPELDAQVEAVVGEALAKLMEPESPKK